MFLSKNNPIREHIYSIPELIETQIDNIFLQAGKLSLPDLQNLREIRITGCGYSYAACLATKYFLQKITGLSIHIEPAIEFARFSSNKANSYKNTLFLGISNSGEVSRINECLQLYKAYQIPTIGLTANKNSSMMSYCDFYIDTGSPALSTSLPLRGYVMTHMALSAIGCRIAHYRNKINKEVLNSVVQDYLHTAKLFNEHLPKIDEACNNFASMCQNANVLSFVGAGYERASAFLGKIESMGQAGLSGIDEDPEQWLHCNFFTSSPEKIPTMLFMSSHSPAYSRSLEAFHYMEHLRRNLCVVTDDIAALNPAESTCVIQIPTINELSAGIIEIIPPSLFVGYLCELIGETYSRGFRDQWKLFQTGCGTTQSKIELH